MSNGLFFRKHRYGYSLLWVHEKTTHHKNLTPLPHSSPLRSGGRGAYKLGLQSSIKRWYFFCESDPSAHNRRLLNRGQIPNASRIYKMLHLIPEARQRRERTRTDTEGERGKRFKARRCGKQGILQGRRMWRKQKQV